MRMKNQNGNALFLILIAVALFAALSYAVTNSGRGGSGIDREQAQIAAGQIVQYASSMEQAIMRLRLTNGCADDEFSFQRDWDGDGTIEDNAEDVRNIGAPSDKTCHVYDSNGANISWMEPKAEWLDGVTGETWYFPRTSCIEDLGKNGTGTGANGFCDADSDATELLITLPGISETLCAAINKGLYKDDTIPEDVTHWASGGNFNGNYSMSQEIGDSAQMMQAKPAYCFKTNDAAAHLPGIYVFYHVLLAR